MKKRRFIAQQYGSVHVKIFDAETGSLSRIVSVGGNIISPPVCTESEMYVGVNVSPGKNVLKFFTLPNCSLKSMTPIS